MGVTRKTRCSVTRRCVLLAVAAVVVAAAPGAALGGAAQPQGQDFAVQSGLVPPPGSATIPTWRDTFTDPSNNTTYTETLVGKADPRTGAGTTTIPTEIIPVDLSFAANGGQAFKGSDVTQAVLASPMFQPADYSAFSNNSGVQYLDAVMRSEFNRVGSSPFHLVLAPTVMPAVDLTVPVGRGQVLAYPSGAQYGCVDFEWLFPQLWSYMNSRKISPTTLPIFLFQYFRGGLQKGGVCQPGFVGVHGAGNPGHGSGAVSSETMGQTWILASYEPAPIRPITPDHPYTFKNVDTLAHEISEWANDPYGQNFLDPYAFPGLAFCDPLFETGDPVNQYTYSLPGNTFFQNLPGNDRTWSVQDEVFLPWFARESPNTTAEPESSSGYGRYTFFGDMNPDPIFHVPATSC